MHNYREIELVDETPSVYTILVSVGLILLSLFVALVSSSKIQRESLKPALTSVAAAVGFTFEAQKTTDVPFEAFKRRLDEIITPSGLESSLEEDRTVIIRIPLSDLFASNSDKIRVETLSLLKGIASVATGGSLSISLNHDNRDVEQLRLNIDRAASISRFLIDLGNAYTRLRILVTGEATDRVEIRIKPKT